MKRLFAFVALAVLVLATGTASGAYYDGENDGSSWENAYVIESSADLVLMRDRVNAGTEPYGKYYKLSADIDLASAASWQKIGSLNAFTGHFDGQGHTIQINISLFDFISTDKEAVAIRNLNLTGNISGDMSGFVYRLESGIIENCSFIGNIRRNTNAAGGTAGFVAIMWEGGTIRNCTVSADILSYAYKDPSGFIYMSASGIVGELYGGTVENCTVKAGTSITSSRDVGGIVIHMDRGTVSNCTVEAGTVIMASDDAGGIVGRMSGGMIENCTVNDGTTITASGHVGGITGYATSGVAISGNSYPSDCTMIGNIPYWNGENYGSSWEKAYVIASSYDLSIMNDRINAGSDEAGKYYKLSADIDLTATNWRGIGITAHEFSGHFDGQGHTIQINEYLFRVISADEGTIAVRNLNIIGNISGDMSGLVYSLRSGIIENCSFRGNIRSNSSLYSGGLVAHMEGGTVRNCTVSADISSTSGDVGGIAGTINTGTIENCVIEAGTSLTTSSGAAGGIAGYASVTGYSGGLDTYTHSTISNCTVKAGVTVNASSRAGGIVGIIDEGNIDSCTVEDGVAITASSLMGGVAGYAYREVAFSGNTYSPAYPMVGNLNYYYMEDKYDGSSWENAYIIASYQDLISMRDRVNDGSDGNGKYYKLSADIDLTTTSGTSWNIRTFTGHFDGQGHTITLSSTDPLFYDISSDKDTIAVRNLNITGNVTDSQIACPLAISLYSGIVENCNFIGTVKSTNSVACGLVYSVEGGTIRNCTVSADILSSEWSGGIAGSLEKGAIENCTIESGTRITALSFDAGGVVGWIIGGGTVENCTVEAGTIITASNDVGGIVGDASNGTITNCTVENGVSISGATNRTGGIAGRSYSTTLSSNTWPSSYSQTGTSSANNEGSNGGNAAPSSTPNPTPQITWNGHRYQAYNENLTWEEAKSRCESLGGHLATITSSLEQSQVENLLRQSTTSQRGYWLGASADISGFWKWTTGEEFERQYTNFPGGQQEISGNYLYMYWTPNSAEGTITASAATNQGEWDCAGNALYGFICEWDNEPSTVQEAPTDSDFQRWQQDPDAYRNTEQSGVPAGSNPSPIDTSHLASNPPNVETPGSIPVSFDARKEGRLPPVRNQGIYETCWAFAALGAMEADYMTHNMASLGTSPDLSELHLAWFAYKYPSSDSYKEGDFNILMEGADPEVAASFLRRSAISPVNEESMPYAAAGNIEEQANQNVITFLNGRTAGSFNKARISITGVLPLDRIPQDGASTINTIKSHIMQHGAVYFSYENLQQGYNDDKTSFYSENEGSPHAALLVGWDDNYPASNFRDTPPANGAWLVRTSRWAEDTTKEIVSTGDEYGCFWMSYSQAYGNNARSGFSGIRLFTVSEDMHEVKENGGSLHTKDITPAWSARIFRAGRNERLIRIGFDTTDNNASYQIFVNKFTGTPTDPGRAENPVLSGDIPNAGYHTLNLPTPIDLYEGNYYAVIVKMLMSPSSSYRYPTAVGASMDKYVQIEVNEAESFFAEGAAVPSVWQDGINVEGGPYKACIMTFTEARTTFDTAPSIMTSSLPDATVGQHYSFILSSSGTQAIEWRSGNIPEDFTLSRTGTLTGQPQEAGQYDINLTAVNDVGYVEKVLSLTVNAAGNTNDSETNNSETNDNNTDNKQTDNTNQEQDKTPDDDNTQNDTQQEDETPSPLNASGGGCDSGIQIAGLAVIFILAGVKRWRRK